MCVVTRKVKSRISRISYCCHIKVEQGIVKFDQRQKICKEDLDLSNKRETVNFG